MTDGPTGYFHLCDMCDLSNRSAHENLKLSHSSKMYTTLSKVSEMSILPKLMTDRLTHLENLTGRVSTYKQIIVESYVCSFTDYSNCGFNQVLCVHHYHAHGATSLIASSVCPSLSMYNLDEFVDRTACSELSNGGRSSHVISINGRIIVRGRSGILL